MRTNYPTADVFHRWAHQRDAHRITNRSNVHADGACLYSYAECIGIITDGRAIISSYNWSMTTNKHQWKARQAASHLNPVYLPCHFPRDGSLPHLAQMATTEARTLLKNIDHGNKARMINKTIAAQYADYCTLLDFASTIQDTLPAARVDTLADLRALRDGQLVQDKLSRLNGKAGALKLSIDAARNVVKRELWHGVEHTIDQIRKLPTECAQLAIDYANDQLPTPDYLTKLPAQAARILPKLEALQAARAAELVRINAEDIAHWRAGDNRQLHRDLPPLLRITGDAIQTSWGASVPVTVAPALWQMVVLARANSVGCTDCGRAKVGDYTLDAINSDGSITVGCHKIAYSELEIIARELKYI